MVRAKIYATGLWVEDHARAIDVIFHKAKPDQPIILAAITSGKT